MKQFTIKISGASSAQLLTIAAELKIMSHAWTKFGPRILINDQEVQEPRLRIPRNQEKNKQALTDKQA
tara:strand:- start:768 stop:971 length:204 start_codon:yes stop_codon:yes gene_type:complete